MRIWQLTGLDLGGVGGVEKHIAGVSAGLRSLGHDVHVGRTLPESWQAPAPEPVIIHTHGDAWPSAALLGGSMRKACLWVHVCHGTSVGRVIACREFMSFSGWRGSLIDFLPAQFADAAVAVGPLALQEARVYFRMSVPARVIPNGADPAIFEALHQITLEPRLIYVGRDADRVKNVPAILAGCEIVAKSVPGFSLWCAPGIDHDPQRHPFVKNLGPLSPPELAKALAQVRALVLCSFYEGDPIVLREAQSMGLGIVASDIPALRANLGGYSNSIFVWPRSVDSIVFGLRSAVTGPAPTPKPRQRPWLDVAREFEGFYRELIAARK